MAIQYRFVVVLSVFSLCMLTPTHLSGGKKTSPKNSRIENQLPNLFKDAESTLYKSSEEFYKEYMKKEDLLLSQIQTFKPLETFQNEMIQLTEFTGKYKENPDMANNMLEGTKEKMKKCAKVAREFAKINHLAMSQILIFTKTLNNQTIEKEIMPLWHQHCLEFKRAVALQRYISDTLVKEEYQEIPEEEEIR